MDLNENPRLLILHKVFVLHLNKIISELEPKNIFPHLRGVPRNVLSEVSLVVEEQRRQLAITLYQIFEKLVVDDDIPQLCHDYEREAIHSKLLESSRLDQEACSVLKGVFDGHGAKYPYSKNELVRFIQSAKNEIPKLQQENQELRALKNQLLREVEEAKRNLLSSINN